MCVYIRNTKVRPIRDFEALNPGKTLAKEHHFLFDGSHALLGNDGTGTAMRHGAKPSQGLRAHTIPLAWPQRPR